MSRLITRRVAIKDLGKAGLAMVVFGAACSTDRTTQTTIGSTTTTVPLNPTTSTTAPDGSTTTTDGQSGAGTGWARVNMGFVSAYILYREGEAALVDTGQAGSEDDIEAALSSIGLSWGAVGHVILTHKHPDHVGSIEAVLNRASGAAVYAGSGDVAAIGQLPSGAGPTPVGDGDNVFDLQIIETPGHTPGHVCVLDAAATILVAGDAMNTVGGTLNPADPAFTDNPTLAGASVKKLAGFDFETALFGHGEPILEGAGQAVADLAAGIPG